MPVRLNFTIAALLFVLLASPVFGGDVEVLSGAARAELNLCISAMKTIAERYQADGEAEITPAKGLEARLIRAASRNSDSVLKRMLRQYHGLNLFEMRITGSLGDHPELANVPRSLLEKLEREATQEGLEISLSRVGGTYFRIEKGKPILVLSPYLTEPPVMHEYQHFLDWKKLKNDLIAKGNSNSRAAQIAGDAFQSPEHIFITESRAKNAELQRSLAILSDANEKNETTFPLVFPYGQRSLPLDKYIRPEDLLAHSAYPYLEQLKAIFHLKKDSKGLKWKFWSLPVTRSKFNQRMDEMAKNSSQEMANQAVSLRKMLVEEALRLAKEATDRGQEQDATEHRATASKLQSASLADLVFQAHDLHANLGPQSEAFREFVERSLFDAETKATQATPNSKVPNEAQEEIKSVLKRIAENEYGNGGFFGGRNNTRIGREYDHQGPVIHESGYAQLDVEALGFNSSRNLQGPNEANVSARRVLSYLHAPITDAKEVRSRQQAVRELADENGLLYNRVKATFDSDKSKSWRKRLFPDGCAPKADNEFQGRRWEYYDYKNILTPRFADRFSQKRLRDAKARFEHFIQPVQSFLREVQSMRTILEGTTSPRLQQLKWVLDSCCNAGHPNQVVNEVNGILKPGDLIGNYKVWLEFKDSKSLALIEEAYAEVAMLFDIARNAREHGWKTFPTILDRDPAIGPVLNVTDLHNVRAQTNSPQGSVPNSIQINSSDGKHLIITGPNAQGKSTLQRTLSQLAILAQLGSPVPASAAEQTPLTILVYVHPSDSPKDQRSLFMAEGKALMTQIYDKAKSDPFTLSIMDEILPGTISEIREDVESEFLKELEKTGGLSVTATHNWGTTALGPDGTSTPTSSRPKTNGDSATPGQFRNFHVDWYHLKPGPASDLGAMYEGAITALRKVGWPEPLLESIRVRGKERERSQK